jgi:hypothetical protein
MGPPITDEPVSQAAPMVVSNPPAAQSIEELKEENRHQEKMVDMGVGKVEEVMGHVLTLTSMTALSRRLMTMPNAWAKLAGIVIALLGAGYAAFSTLPGWIHRTFSSGDVIGSWWGGVAAALGYATPSRVRTSLDRSNGFAKDVVGQVNGWLTLAKPLRYPFMATVALYESSGDPRLRGPNGEYGIFQLNKQWFEDWCKRKGEDPMKAAINSIKYAAATKDYILTYFNPALMRIESTTQSPLVKLSLAGIAGRPVPPNLNLFAAHALWKDGGHGKLSATKAVNTAARTLTSAMMVRPDTIQLMMNNTTSGSLASLKTAAPSHVQNMA